MSSRLREEEARAWQALLHGHQLLTRWLNVELREGHGISLVDYDILLRLASAQPAGLAMTDIARRVSVPASTLTRRVDALVSSGLVERDRSQMDSRVVLARLTVEGRRLLRRAAITHLRGIRNHFTGRLSLDQLRVIADGLEVITGSHREH
jgi:DNA-binding MarR family transcriptional regulator